MSGWFIAPACFFADFGDGLWHWIYPDLPCNQTGNGKLSIYSWFSPWNLSKDHAYTAKWWRRCLQPAKQNGNITHLVFWIHKNWIFSHPVDQHSWGVARRQMGAKGWWKCGTKPENHPWGHKSCKRTGSHNHFPLHSSSVFYCCQSCHLVLSENRVPPIPMETYHPPHENGNFGYS